MTEYKNPFPRELFDFEKRALSYSSMKHILKTPAHFAEYWTAPRPPQTQALIFGSLIDCMTFTPEEFDVRFVISQGFDRRTKEGKAAYELFMATCNGRMIVDAEDIELAKKLASRVKEHPLSKPLYDSCTNVQLELKWSDKSTALPMRGYLDAVTEIEEQTIIWDLKSSEDASHEQFERDCVKYGYPLQAYAYCNAYIKNRGVFPEFRFVVVEKSTPYAVNVFRPDNKFMELGKAMYRRALDRIKFCHDNDCFDVDYDFMCSNGYNLLSVPGWALKNY